MKNKIGIVITFLFLLDVSCLIFFGKSYSKLTLFPPFFYAHDLVLLLLSGVSLFFFRKENRIKSIEVLFVLSLLYLIWSFFRINVVENQHYYILRQFMIFGYGLCIYIIMNAIIRTPFVKDHTVRIITYFGFICLILQIFYLSYLYVFLSLNPFFERNYFSPIVIMGFFVTGSFILSQVSNSWVKHLLFLLVFLISFSTGHDSTYLGLGIIYFAYLFIVSQKNYKIVLALAILASIVAVFVFLPSFTDVNVQWRLLFWKDSIMRIANNYFLFGDGFGTPYASADTVEKLNELFPDTPYNPIIRGDEIFLTAPHNSFLSIAIHTGMVSLILLFYPIKNLFSNKNTILDKEILFLSLSLLGIVVFSSFNVILELPHSSSIFWIVFFSLIFKLSQKRELQHNR